MPGPLLAIAGAGAAVNIIGGLIGSGKARKQAAAARREQLRQQKEINALKESRAKIINPYAGVTDLSQLATDLSTQLNNPYANLGVATKAAEIQMEQTDMALANTLDTLAATGASAGGATALAQAALASKKGVAANIEQQEAQNEKLRAQGEQQLQQMKISEQQRLQQIAISEGQRVQAAQAAGQQFMFQAQETRTNMDLNRAAGLQDRALQQEAQANMNQASAIGGAISGIGSLAGSLIGAGAFGEAGGAGGAVGAAGGPMVQTVATSGLAQTAVPVSTGGGLVGTGVGIPTSFG